MCFNSFICGHIISADGIQPSSFSPHSSTWLAPLHHLLNKNTKWSWRRAQDRAFRKVKESLTSLHILAHFDQDLPLILESDASPYGVGAVLSHEMEDGSTKPISFASRSLTPTEKRYAHLDKETLALIFGVKRFYLYLVRSSVLFQIRCLYSTCSRKRSQCLQWHRPGFNDGP